MQIQVSDHQLQLARAEVRIMFMQNFGETNKEYYGIFESGLYFSITVVNYIYAK